MKIVHLVSYDNAGAGRAAVRISDALTSIGEESSVIALKRQSNKKTISIIQTNKDKIKWYMAKSINTLRVKKSNTKHAFSDEQFGIDISHVSQIRQADIINLHWVNNGFISYNMVEKISNWGKPVIWTLHDMWPFTGGCHYDQECNKYYESCSYCPELSTNKKYDLASILQEKKKKLFNGNNIFPVGCSNWITECASKSYIWKEKRCVCIPNCIDVNIFKPIEKNIAKELMDIQTEKKIILFGAISATTDKRKGFQELKKALNLLDKNKYYLVIFGNYDDPPICDGFEYKNLGVINDDITLTIMYNIADVFIAPSLQENLANTIMESLACGTPVVAFDIGGMPDLIKHKINGYLARKLDSVDLVNGIEFCSNSDFSKEARQYVLDNYTFEMIGNKYANYYKQVIREIGYGKEKIKEK